MPILSIPNIQTLDAIGLYKQVGSIKQLRITDVDNIGIDRNAMIPGNVYTIDFRQYSCGYNEEEKKTRAGAYIEHRVDAYIPRYRYAMEVMRRKLRNRRVYVLATDWHDNVHKFVGRITIGFETGKRPGDSNGYSISITGASTGKDYVLVFPVYYSIGDEGYTGGSDFTQNTVEVSPPMYSAADCCVTIQETPVAVAPTPTGNVVNLNRMVTTVTGERYFIDKDGVSIRMSNDIIREVVQGTNSSTYPLTNITDWQRTIAIRTTNTLMRSVNPADISHYNVDSGSLILPDIFPLEVGEYVEVIKL